MKDIEKSNSGTAETKSSHKKQRDIFEQEDYDKKKKKALIFGGFGTAAIGLVVAFVLVVPGLVSGSNTDVNAGATTSAQPTKKAEPTPSYTEGGKPDDFKGEFWERPGNKYPEAVNQKLVDTTPYEADKAIAGVTSDGSVDEQGNLIFKDSAGNVVKIGDLTGEDKASSGSETDSKTKFVNGEFGILEYGSLSNFSEDLFSETGLISASQTLPSEKAGYTADDSKIFNPDGTFNTDYSYWTAESFQAATGNYIARLTSPEYGGWSSFQFSDTYAANNFDPAIFTDMFTRQFVEENQDKPFKEWVPIYADWDSNDYGLADQLMFDGPRWFGNVTGTVADFKFNDDLAFYTVDMEVKIKYIAWSKDQTKLERTGTLNLELVPNSGEYAKYNGFKVLINKASLKVDG